MYDDPSGRRNASGYADPTYHRATTRYEMDGRKNAARCIRAMLDVANSLNCEVLTRIEVRDRATGEESR